jgi:hypothetical protein
MKQVMVMGPPGVNLDEAVCCDCPAKRFALHRSVGADIRIDHDPQAFCYHRPARHDAIGPAHLRSKACGLKKMQTHLNRRRL